MGESYKRGVELIFLRPPLPISLVDIDASKMGVVLQNLVENAIKYSNKGDRVIVNVSEKEDMVEISVRDTGIGIQPEDQANIFGKFFRAPNAKKQDTVGSGLGLYTTKRIVEHHQGKIWFESKIGEGTTFFVRLPKTKSVAEQPLICTRDTLYPHMNKKILIVEDDSFLQGLASNKLEKEGFTVWGAANSDEANKVLDTESPDVVLLDLVLPGTDGFGILKHIRETEKTKNIPVVIFSNLSDDSDIKRAKDLGATEFMVKSNFTLDELSDRIKELLA